MTDSSDLLFNSPAPPYVATARQIIARNRDAIARSFPTYIHRHEALLDGLYALASAHVWTFHLTRQNPSALQRLVFSATHKNLVALLGLLENIRACLLGPVRPLFRQVLEGQLLAKFAVVRGDKELAERWLGQESLSIPHVVFSNMDVQQANVLRTMWQRSHVFVHSSTGSQQVSLDADANLERVAHDLTVMGMLLHTQHHLTTRLTFSRRERYYSEAYGKDKTIPGVRRQMRAMLSADLEEHGKDVRAFIRVFRSTWRDKNGIAFANTQIFAPET